MRYPTWRQTSNVLFRRSTLKMEANQADVSKNHKNNNDRIPTIEDLKINQQKMKVKLVDMNIFLKKNNYLLFKEEPRNRECTVYNYCLISVIISFIFGLSVGIIITSSPGGVKANLIRNSTKINSNIQPNKEFTVKKFSAVTFTGTSKYKDVYPQTMTENMKDILKDKRQLKINKVKDVYVANDQTVLYDNIYWGPKIENAMPQGYGDNSVELWESYVDKSEVVKMESGCGRMQNRLVTFRDGLQACVRYRQNTDQIQGELFSFYVGRLLNLTNLAPTVVKVVDLKDNLWSNVAADLVTAKWNTNRAVALTQYIPSLESANIPEIFKPSNRHLNKYDVLNMSLKENDTDSKDILLKKLKSLKTKTPDVSEPFSHVDMNLSKKLIELFVELAQWSDLIIFDYLTANLDRIVNNLFNYQWNVNIMDGPAHNLARKMDSGLLLFLDNESGLLHGYRLLKKFNVYHSLMLDNLCVFRKTTVDALKKVYDSQSIGKKLNDIFQKKNNAVVRDVLPPLPEKNAKILNERIGKVLSQVEKCEQKFSYR